MEFRQYKFRDICQVINGRAYLQPELQDKGKYRILRVGNFFSSDRWYYSDMELPANKYCEKGDLLFAWSASFGPKIWTEEKVIYHYHIWKLIPSLLADKYYLYYWLRNSVSEITKGIHGSVMAHITKNDMENQIIQIPSLQDQKKISSILSSLDAKIELNTQINHNLEEQAKTLFLREYPFSIDDDLPAGWKKGTLDDIIMFHDSKRIPLSSSERAKRAKIYPYYGAAAQMDYVDNYLFDGIYLLLGEDGTVVTEEGFPVLQYVWGKFWVNNHAHILTGKSGFCVETLYLLLQKAPVKSIVTGAVQPKISQTNLKGMPVVIPPKEKIESLGHSIAPIFEQIRNNLDENKKLAQLRDTLLPKLMSGEIDVSEVEI